MHLAALAGRPLVAVFGGWNWGRFLPNAETSMIFAELPCRAGGAPLSVRDIPVGDVVRAWRGFCGIGGGAWVVEMPESAAAEMVRQSENVGLSRRGLIDRVLGRLFP
jgi:hypothetical protein